MTMEPNGPLDRPPESTSKAATASQPGAGTMTTAKEQAGDMAEGAMESAKQVAGEAATQASAVVDETKQQMHQLVDQTKTELQTQLDTKARDAARGLKTLTGQMSALANGRPQEAGQLTGYVTDVQRRVQRFADKLDREGPQVVATDLARFARRRPATFLMAAGTAGFLIGRLVRASAAASRESSSQSSQQWSAPNADYAAGQFEPSRSLTAGDAARMGVTSVPEPNAVLGASRP